MVFVITLSGSLLRSSFMSDVLASRVKHCITCALRAVMLQIVVRLVAYSQPGTVCNICNV